MPKRSIQEHMKEYYTPNKVEKLYKVGRKSYTTGAIACKAWQVHQEGRHKGNPLDGGGRGPGWLQQTFNQPEADIVNRLKKIESPPTYTLYEIDKSVDRKDEDVGQTQVQFNVVQGVGANDLHRTEMGKGVFMVASQFNFQEAPDYSQKRTVEDYRSDQTQGPQAAIEAGAAALHRRAAELNGKLPHALQNVISHDLLSKCYKNGYLQPGLLNESDQKRLLRQIKENKDKLTILPQWVSCESSGHQQMQVFCAAPSFNFTNSSGLSETENNICKELVVAQYRATAQLAVLRSRETGQRCPLNLTMVGQGAFKNDPSVMKEAMKAVADVIKGEDVDVFVHAWSDKDKNTINSQLSEASIEAIQMNCDTFRKKSYPTKHQEVTSISKNKLSEFTRQQKRRISLPKTNLETKIADVANDFVTTVDHKVDAIKKNKAVKFLFSKMSQLGGKSNNPEKKAATKVKPKKPKK